VTRNQIYLRDEAVDGDPRVDVDDRAKPDGNKLVVVRNVYEVLIKCTVG
jgi:hypothetical protein